MATTTATRAWTPRDTAQAVAVLFVAICLLILAGSELLTQLSRIPANSYYKQNQSRFLSGEDGPSYLRDTADRLQRIPPNRRGEQEWRRLATTWLLLPPPDQPADAPDGQQQRLAEIETAVNATLVRAPVQPLGWAYLTSVRLPPAGNCEQAMAALRQSYQVAPVEPDVLAYRLQLASQCPMQWDTAFLNALRTDLLSAYGENLVYARNRAFILWLTNQPRLKALVKLLLSNQPDALEQLKRELKRFSS